MPHMDTDDGLGIPSFLDRRTWVKKSGYRHAVRERHRKKTAKEKRFSDYARRRAARKRAKFEWR